MADVAIGTRLDGEIGITSATRLQTQGTGDTWAADAYRTTGTSPTNAATTQRNRSYDTVHLVGPGAVGRSLLTRLADGRRRVIAVTDSGATVHDPHGIDVPSIVTWKQAGRPLHAYPGARPIASAQALALVDADVVADASSTDLDRPGWTAALGAALERGACVATAAKAALCDAGAEWLSGDHRTRVGCNAVLGGTGRSFLAELPDLQSRAREITIAGNASTTAILEVVELGGTLDEGIAEAQRLGFLEPDPELDLRGTDAAIKLAIVAGIITARRIDPRSIPCEDIRAIDLMAVRARARRHATTRLIGRLDAAGGLRVAYEEISRDSILAVPCGRVVYEYRLTRDERRFHIGSGLGAHATAGALWADVSGLAAEAAARSSRLRADTQRAQPLSLHSAAISEVAR